MCAPSCPLTLPPKSFLPFSALHTASQPEHVELQTKVTSELYLFIAHRTDDTRLLPEPLATRRTLVDVLAAHTCRTECIHDQPALRLMLCVRSRADRP